MHPLRQIPSQRHKGDGDKRVRLSPPPLCLYDVPLPAGRHIEWGRAEGHRIETAELWTYDEEGVHRGSGGLEAHDRFAVAGFDLGALLAGGAA